MKLEKKKEFVAKVLGVGKGRILFNKNRLSEIKEAMTRQDIKDLFNSNAILIREIKGRKKIKRRKTRRRRGSIRQPVQNKKKKYIILARKLRSYVSELKKSGKLTQEQFIKLRQEIKASAFKDKSHLKDRIKSMEVKK
ncbi:MAG: 50S ribosomal protein L19e [Candidatus Pacearchaeota archaeon]